MENKVGYSRRNAFVPVPTITSFNEFNESPWEWCEKDAERPNYKKKLLIEELWKENEASLLHLPEYPFPVFRYAALTVNKNGFATIETNKYGLFPMLSGETVQAKIYFDYVELSHGHHPVGHYRSSYKTNDEVYDWTQYVSVLFKKPGAIEHTRFFRQMPQQWQTFLEQTSGRERKNALQLLSEIVSDGNDALELAGENGHTDADSLCQCYYMIAKKEYRPNPLKLPSSPALHYNPNLSAYDGLHPTKTKVFAGTTEMGADANV